MGKRIAILVGAVVLAGGSVFGVTAVDANAKANGLNVSLTGANGLK